MKIYAKKAFLLIITILLMSCAPPKYTIKYDVDQVDKKITQDSNSKIGILLFQDNRPPIESKGNQGAFTDTRIIRDEFFEKSIPVMAAELMHTHLKSFGSANITVLDRKSNEIDFDYLSFLKKEQFDYVLIGTIDHFTLMTYDEHATARNATAFVSGCFFPFSLILFPFAMVGDLQITTETDFNNLYLLKIDGPQILWRGQCKNKTMEKVALTDTNSDAFLRLYSNNVKQSIACISDGLSLSSDMDYPNKISVDHTKRIIDHMNKNKSLININY